MQVIQILDHESEVLCECDVIIRDTYFEIKADQPIAIVPVATDRFRIVPLDVEVISRRVILDD